MTKRIQQVLKFELQLSHEINLLSFKHLDLRDEVGTFF
jgi:DNA-directed RNA polymerase specialized sigma54-like protein